MKQNFSRREVEKSFRKFNDLVQDLFSCQFQGWAGCFNNLVEHCEHDSVMQVVVEPLKNNTNVNAEDWYQKTLDSQSGMVGSGNYALPYDDDERTALIYQLSFLCQMKIRISICLTLIWPFLERANIKKCSMLSIKK